MAIEYLNNEAFQAAVIALQEARRNKVPEAQEEVTGYFYTLAANVITGFKFVTLDYDDALQECVLVALTKVDKFDADFVGKNGRKARAFNYFTTCMVNHLRQMYRNSGRFNETRRKYYEHIAQQTDQHFTK